MLPSPLGKRKRSGRVIHKISKLAEKNKKLPVEETKKPLLDLSDDSEVFDFSVIPDRSKGVKPFKPEEFAEIRPFLAGKNLNAWHFLRDIDERDYLHACFWRSYDGNLNEFRLHQRRSPPRVKSEKVLTNHRYTHPKFRREIKDNESFIDPSLVFSKSERVRLGI